MTPEDCGASGCIFAPNATGMRANGGCQHLKGGPQEVRALLLDAAAALAATRAALDEARRERDEAVTRAAKAEAFAVTLDAERTEISNRFMAATKERDAVAAQAEEWAAMCGREQRQRAAREAERNEARQALAALLDAHASPSDATRIAGHRAAMETRRGWGM